MPAVKNYSLRAHRVAAGTRACCEKLRFTHPPGGCRHACLLSKIKVYVPTGWLQERVPAVKNWVRARTSNVQARAGTRVIGKNAPQAHNPICGFKNLNGKGGGVATALCQYSIVFQVTFQMGSELLAAMISSGQVLNYCIQLSTIPFGRVTTCSETPSNENEMQ